MDRNCFWDPLKVNLMAPNPWKGTCLERNTSFDDKHTDPIGVGLIDWIRKRKKNYKKNKASISHKTVIFYHNWLVIFQDMSTLWKILPRCFNETFSVLNSEWYILKVPSVHPPPWYQTIPGSKSMMRSTGSYTRTGTPSNTWLASCNRTNIMVMPVADFIGSTWINSAWTHKCRTRSANILNASIKSRCKPFPIWNTKVMFGFRAAASWPN